MIDHQSTITQAGGAAVILDALRAFPDSLLVQSAGYRALKKLAVGGNFENKVSKN